MSGERRQRQQPGWAAEGAAEARPRPAAHQALLYERLHVGVARPIGDGVAQLPAAQRQGEWLPSGRAHPAQSRH